ncbi:MAG TPA: 50S ribosomal protein L11 methyltransferase [Solimonas sp.]|nr:50S ribosomal protein L11 methyltransferase [Solimonas sp.]
MAWLQLRVATRYPEFAEEVLLAHGAAAVSFIDAHNEPVLEPAPGETRLWRETVTLGLFAEDTEVAPIAQALAELLPDGAQVTVEPELVEDRDWVRAWLDHWRPLRFGERLWVAPAEKLGEITDADAIVVRLDPGLAFGTGTHPTTALCLEWLAGQDLRGRRLLDYGCGSGILAIAALKLGAAHAVCVDLDPQALLATRNNAQDNGVAERITTLAPESFVPFPADVVVANILANPLVALAPLLASSIRPVGMLALAGLLERQADDVRAAYLPWFDFAPGAIREGWTRLAARCRVPQLINFLRIDAQLATAGQPQREHFPLLAADGYEAVINLAMPASPNFLSDEAALCAQHGLQYFHIPVPWEHPTAQDFERFCALADELAQRKLLVHCALNKRVSAFVYLLRVLRRGVDAEDAARDLRRIWEPEPGWRDFIDRMLAQPSSG